MRALKSITAAVFGLGLLATSSIPAQADPDHCWHGRHRGWANNWHDSYNSGACGNNSGGFNAFSDINRFNGSSYNNFGRYGNDNRLFEQDFKVSNEIQRIQNRLASGNLSPSKAADLQDRLAHLQGRQSQLNGLLSTDLTNRQSQIQNLLNSGNLSPGQAFNLRNRLAQLQNEQSLLTSGNTGVFNGLRNWFRGY